MSQGLAVPGRPSIEAARQHPIAWAAYVCKKYHAARHLKFVGNLLLELERAPAGARIALSMPPRHSKSWTVSRFFAAWYLGRHPEQKVILVSVQEHFSRKWSRMARDDFAQFGPEVFGVTALPRASTAEWDVYRDGERLEGSMSAIGAGGTIVGKGADLMIIEDLVRNDKEAHNVNLMEDQWDWFLSAIETRLEPPGRVIIPMTRWTHFDLVGRLKQAQKEGELGDEWRFVNMPALSDPIPDEPDPLGRAPGEALWPEKRPVKWLEKKRKNVTAGGSTLWERHYQGRPTMEAGDTFKRIWFKYFAFDDEQKPLLERKVVLPKVYPIPVRDLYRFATVDLAASMRKRSDYTVMSVWGYSRSPHALALLDMVRDRLNGHEIVELLHSRQEAYGLQLVYVEKEGRFIEDRLGSVVRTAAGKGVRVVELVKTKDKRERALSVQNVFSEGYVYYPKTQWLPLLEDEMLQFPDGEHDDMVDTCVDAAAIFQELVRLGVGGAVEGPRSSKPDGEIRPTPPPSPGVPQWEPEWNPGFEGEWT